MIDYGDTAWVLISAALVLLMAPALALFYGGMVRGKSVLNMMMMTFGAAAQVSILWVLYGYSMAFGDDLGGGLLGDPTQFAGLAGLMSEQAVVARVPSMAFAGFQSAFAIITVALISGAVADRARFGAWMLFVGVWATAVYFPVAHWVFAFDGATAGAGSAGGWIANRLGAIDFAGGTAVHINAGAAGLALALVLGKRIGFGEDPMRPHNRTLVILGAGLLWFGWFGFNAGSALSANTVAGVAWINTLVAPAAAALSWMAAERLRDGHATSLGAASGLVSGLVAITPAAHSVDPLGALAIGGIAGVACAFAIGLKFRLGYDDSLDVVGVHLVGGLVGSVLIGVFATAEAPAHVDGLLYGGGLGLLERQAIASGAVLGFSLAATLAIARAIDLAIGFRVDPESEAGGVDLALHAEAAYDFDPLSWAPPARRTPPIEALLDGERALT